MARCLMKQQRFILFRFHCNALLALKTCLCIAFTSYRCLTDNTGHLLKQSININCPSLSFFFNFELDINLNMIKQFDMFLTTIELCLLFRFTFENRHRFKMAKLYQTKEVSYSNSQNAWQKISKDYFCFHHTKLLHFILCLIM